MNLKKLLNRESIESVVLFIAQLLFLYPISQSRLIELDSGYYAIAAKLVSQGELPYLDFFYPQMPFFPFLYAIPVKLFGPSWDILRGFSAVLSALCGTLIFNYVRSKTSFLWGVISILFFLSSNLVFPWYTTIKSYPITALLLFGAFVALQGGETTWRKAFICGLLIGLAVETRLYVVVVLVVPFLAYIYDRNYSALKALILGFALAMIPALLFVLYDFDAFIFNNLGYHLSRADNRAQLPGETKQLIFLKLFSLRHNFELGGYQFPLLILLSVPFLIVWRVTTSRAAEVWFFLTLFVVSFIPDPPYLQYYSLVMPFLVIMATYGLKRICERLNNKVLTAVLLVFIFSVYFKNVLYDIDRYTATGIGVPGIGNPINAETWNVRSIRELSKKIDGLTVPGEVVYAGWSGYLFETHAVSYPGTENRFGLKVADQLTPASQARYRVTSRAKIMQLVRERKVSLVIEAAGRKKQLTQAPSAKLGYTLAGSVGKIGIFQRPLHTGTAGFQPAT